MCVQETGSRNFRNAVLLRPFVQTCSCARTTAFSLIHADLVNTDVKTAAGLILLFPPDPSKGNVYFFGDVLKQMEMSWWG